MPGHWEGDLITGSKNSHIATLVERHTRYVMLVKVANKDTRTVVSALIKQAKTLPGELYNEGEKPKGMHWRTYDRIYDQLDDLEGELDRKFIIGAMRILGW